ncbi:unnamed protein product [Durusdinium trenchii]|uniref:Uroporphyrinogen decarboxylase (URO-D) domain-containing protein n=1 Tax=Durusdinium trenchii TaxID=1381693 RepID=A0ABP0P9I3_9DINO
MGIEFDVIRGRGPIVLGDLARTLKDRLEDGPNQIRAVESSEAFLKSHAFVQETLQVLRSETEGKCSLLGFVGAPWTLAAYAVEVVQTLRKACPDVPIIYFANGGSPYFSDQVKMLAGHIDVIGVDAHMRMKDAAEVVETHNHAGPERRLVLQGNVDPFLLRYGEEDHIRKAVRAVIDEAGGPGRHILNLGHGVLQGTPEENVLYFVDEAQSYAGSSK